MKEFELRELKSRKLKTVTPILWVGAAVALTAQGFPAWEEPKQFKQSQKRIAQTVPELNNYPETPTGYYSGFFPGSQIAEVTKKQSKYSVQQLPELNSYPPTPAPVSYAAIVESGYNFNDGLKRKPLSVELNDYPSTPDGYYSGFYPGSSLATGFKARFDRSLQTVELNEYPSAPPSPAILPAFIAQDIFYRPDNRKLLFLPELNEYPATPAATPVWTVQSNDATSWSAQTNDSTMWTVQTNDSTNWDVE